MNQQRLFGDISGARFSDCGTYRYLLYRGPSEGKTLNYIMLNPSTADEVENDPTVERCLRRAWALGYHRIVVTNLFAFRATDPRELCSADDPVGPENDGYIIDWARWSDAVICAWGNHGNLVGRADKVLSLLRGKVELFYLKLNGSGQPAHPLYLPYDCPMKPWGER